MRFEGACEKEGGKDFCWDERQKEMDKIGKVRIWKEMEALDYNLERFKSAQEYDYDTALREIRNGRKTSHWMWYIFPQLQGLGHSSMADYYGIRGAGEAQAYLTDSVLGPRLIEISEALLGLEKKDAAKIFGFPDVLKLHSCMTLFAAVSEAHPVFQRVLEEYYHGERDERTVELLRRNAEKTYDL